MMFRDMICWDVVVGCTIGLISFYFGIDIIPAIMIYCLGAFHVSALIKT